MKIFIAILATAGVLLIAGCPDTTTSTPPPPPPDPDTLLDDFNIDLLVVNAANNFQQTNDFSTVIEGTQFRIDVSGPASHFSHISTIDITIDGCSRCTPTGQVSLKIPASIPEDQEKLYLNQVIDINVDADNNEEIIAVTTAITTDDENRNVTRYLRVLDSTPLQPGDCLASSFSECRLSYQPTQPTATVPALHAYQTTDAGGVFETVSDSDVWHVSLPAETFHTILVEALPADTTSTGRVRDAISGVILRSSLADSVIYRTPLVEISTEDLADGHHQERFLTDANIYQMVVTAPNSDTVVAGQKYRITLTQTDRCTERAGMLTWLALRNQPYVEPYISRGICTATLGTETVGNIIDGHDTYHIRLTADTEYQATVGIRNVTEEEVDGRRRFPFYINTVTYRTFNGQTNVSYGVTGTRRIVLPENAASTFVTFFFRTPPGTGTIDAFLETGRALHLLNGQYHMTITEVIP